MEDKILHSPFPPFDLPEGLLCEIALKTFDKFPDKVFLIHEPNDSTMTFSEVKQQVLTVAYNMRRLGFAPGDTLAIQMANSPGYIVVILAAWYLGVTCAGIIPFSVSKEIQFYLSLVPAKYYITTEDHAEDVKTAAKNSPLQTIFSTGEVEGCAPYSELLRAVPPGEQPPPCCDMDSSEFVSAICFSSGTTGLPKAVQITDAAMKAANVKTGADGLNLSGNTVLLFLPLAHLFGLAVICNSVYFAKSIIIMPRFDLQKFLEYIVSYKCTHLVVAPPLMVLLAKHPLVDKYDLSHVTDIVSGAAPQSSDVEVAVIKRLGNPDILIRQGYGMTEASGTLCIPPSPGTVVKAPLPAGSVGVPFIDVSLKIVDVETRQTLGAGERGEIIVKTPSVMKGYLGNPGATAATLDEDGWLCTGDIGYYDTDGYVFIVDRLKELIKYKGHQVAPAELEALLLTHPLVADAGVIGLPAEELGELPHAWIVIKQGASLTEDNVIKFVEEKVSPVKRLRGGVTFVKAIPKSPAGKILRREIRTKMAEKRAGGDS